jgi:molybdate transport system substrate-binding protein
MPIWHQYPEYLYIGRIDRYRGKLATALAGDEMCSNRAKGKPMEFHDAVALPPSRGPFTRAVSATLLACALSLIAATGHAAGITVMCDSPVEPALTKVADRFRQETGNQVTLACDAGPVIKKRIEDGAVADLVVVEPDFVEQLTAAGKVRAGDRPVIGHVGVGLGNRVGSPAYDISTVEKFKSALLGADHIVFNSVKSGEAFAKVLEQLGIAETLKPKIVRTAPLDIFKPVLAGKGNDVAAGTIPLIATTPGIKLLGPLPGDLQSAIPYTAALTTSAPQLTTAKSFIEFLVSPRAKETFAANGVT